MEKERGSKTKKKQRFGWQMVTSLSVKSIHFRVKVTQNKRFIAIYWDIKHQIKQNSALPEIQKALAGKSEHVVYKKTLNISTHSNLCLKQHASDIN